LQILEPFDSMKTIFRAVRLGALALACFAFISTSAHAQDAEDGGWGSSQSASERYSSSGSAWGTSGETMGGTMRDSGPGLPTAPTQVPVDGGLALLAAAGAAYAANRLRRREGSEDEDAEPSTA
jgi:hypothetical protein